MGRGGARERQGWAGEGQGRGRGGAGVGQVRNQPPNMCITVHALLP